MSRALRDLIESVELWAAVAAALVAANLLALTRQRRPGLAVAVAIGVASVAYGVGSGAVALLLVVMALAWPATDGSFTSILASVAAASAAYACVPDTERALVVLGAVVAVGAAALVWRWRWEGAAPVTSVALAWVAVTDGSARPSAVVGTLGVVAIHHLLQLRLPAGRRTVPFLAVGVVAMAVSARWRPLGQGQRVR